MQRVRIQLFILSFILLVYNNVSAQIPVGEWRTHFSFNNIVSVCSDKNYIYAAGETELFKYDKATGNIEKIGKINGLSDAGINKINFNPKTKTLFIAYSNSNIDIIRNDSVFNFSEIKRKQINGSKIINNISFKGDSAYLACGFGIVVFDTRLLEFKDTYYIGENSEMINVNKVAASNAKIFAATDLGLYYADISSQLLYDYRNWSKVTDIPNPNFKCNEVGTLNNITYVSQKQDNTEETYLYKYENNIWEIFDPELNFIKAISQTDQYITFANDGKIKVYDKFKNPTKALTWYVFSDTSTYIKANEAIVDENTNIWIADKRFGLVSKLSGKSPESILPDGPEKNLCNRMLYSENKIICSHGSASGTTYAEASFSIFDSENWQTFYARNTDGYDFFSICVNPQNKENIFFGSWGEGVFEFKNKVFQTKFDENNSTLQTIADYVRISDMVFDANNNLWIANWGVSSPVSVKTNEGNWYGYNFGGTASNKYTDDILLTDQNHKWLLLRNQSGILVFDDNSTPENQSDDRYKTIYPISSDGETISKDVYSLAQDKEGNIWVGTDNGVAVFYNPSQVFDTEPFYADRIILTAYGNDTTQQYLLTTDVVTKIVVDGANRKWLGTQNSGLFLVSDNGKTEVHNFNTENSPLVSNTIHDIAINSVSGEIFIANEGGILSFRSDATDADENYSEVYVFPNPVHPDFEGYITVTGLAENVNVKFTDISGNIVYETFSLGGQAIWNGKTFDGRKVNTGVYLIFCSNSDGTSTYVSKLLFIN